LGKKHETQLKTFMSQKECPNSGNEKQRKVIVPTPPPQKPNVEPRPRPVMPVQKPQPPLIPNQPPKPGKKING
jgi:hypothetical protein